MATYTNNLNLEKPDKTEQYSIDVFNANAEKIDNFSGLTPPRALTADKLTTGANINGVLFDGTKDIEIPSNDADINLSNLSTIGADKLNTSKMYLTGSVSTDEQGYNQLEEMYHSTFDLSKFEVVGSPNITSDGVASGFGNNDHIRPIETFDFSQNWKIKFDIETGDVIDAQTLLRFGSVTPVNYVVITDQGMISLRLQGLSGWSSLDTNYSKPLKPNSSYTVFVEKNNNVYSIGYIDADNSVVKNTRTNENSLPESDVYLGVGSGWFFKGSIKLATVSITADGKPVFNGNKTGLDVIKPDDYTVVGSPNITSDGVASGFEVNNNYIKPNNVISIGGSSWRISGRAYAVENIKDDRYQPIFVDVKGEYRQLNIAVNRYGTGFVLEIREEDNTVVINAGAGDKKFLPNSWHDFEVVYENKTIYFYIDSILSFQTQVDLDNRIFNNRQTIGTTLYQGSQVYYGSIDLNAFKIYVDGNLVYQHCLKIPYTESKTGSKIVPAYARDRVQDVYEQYGQAEYYTIDEENKNFTLPMGEIYGMIETAKSNISFRAIGEILRVTATDDYVPDGTLYIGAIQDRTSSEFQQLWDNWLVKGLLPTCSYSEYELEVTVTGACYKWAVDTENGTFRTPFVPDRIIHNVKDKALVEYNMDTTNSQMFRYPAVDSSGKLNPIVGGAMSSDNTVGWGPYSTSSVANAKFGAAYFNGTGIKTIDGVGISGSWVPMNVDPNGTMQADLTSSVITSTIKHFVVISNGSINKSQRDWSKFESGLNSKVNTDLSNITQSGKANAVSWGMPDYSRQIEITLVSSGTTTYTAPSDGFLWGKQISGTTDMPITINNNKVFGHKASSGTVSNPFYFQVAKGDVVVISNAATSSPNNYAYFAPMKGVN